METCDLEVTNWGPVASGRVEFRKMTVFVGANNTGKSYIAMLFYALVRAFRGAFSTIKEYGLFGVGRFPSVPEGIVEGVVRGLEPGSEPGKDVLKDLVCSVCEKHYVPLIREVLVKSGPAVRSEIERVFSSDVGEIISRGSRQAAINFRLNGRIVSVTSSIRIDRSDNLDMDVDVKIDCEELIRVLWRDRSRVRRAMEAMRRAREYSVRSGDARFRRAILAGVYELLRRAFILIMEDVLRALPDVFYLPASRAGILHSYRTVAKAIISLAPLAPIRGAEIPKIPGPIADFLGELMEITPEYGAFRRLSEKSSGELGEISEELERFILEGEVKLVREAPEAPPTLIYRFNGEEVPMARVSSMVAEIAPLDLYLKYGVVKPGDLIIIEEPEAHLHPDKQAKLAEIFVKLVNRVGIRVVVTTHSEVFLAKLSNLVSLSGLPREEVEELGFTMDSVLRAGDVSVYRFVRAGDGAVSIEEVGVTREGIPDDVFREIVEDLYEETMDIYYRVQGRELRGE